MLTSVVIPAYNCISSLKSTVDSILNSGLTDCEILLIDDGSTDGTSALCDELQTRHECVRCVHQENAGVSSARNRGILESKGRYILFFDADDTVDAGSLERCRRILAQEAPDMLIFGMSFDYYFRGRLYRRDEAVSPAVGQEPMLWQSRDWEALYACNALSPVWNKFIRRALLEEHGIAFPGGMIEMEDFLFSVRCLRRCESVVTVSEAIYRYRQPEKEDNTYRRLCRIPDLGAYMEPFEAELEEIPGGENIAAGIYEAFFYQMLRFGDIQKIERTAKDMLSGRYAARIEAHDPGLYRLLKDGRYRRVRCKNAARRLRHALAVRIRYLRNGGKAQ